jgi:hypothetical protein
LGLIWLKEVELEHEGVRREEEGVSLFFFVSVKMKWKGYS